jgi:hypothetical protein
MATAKQLRRNRKQGAKSPPNLFSAVAGASVLFPSSQSDELKPAIFCLPSFTKEYHVYLVSDLMWVHLRVMQISHKVGSLKIMTVAAKNFKFGGWKIISGINRI